MNKIIIKESNIRKIVSEAISLILLREVYKKTKINNINENAYAENLDNEYYAVNFDEVGKLRNDIYNMAWSFTKNKDDADELTQNTILRAFEKSDLFKDGTNLMGWLRTIMTNLFKRSKSNSHAKKMSYIDDYTPYEKNNGEEIDIDGISDDNTYKDKEYDEIKQELFQIVDELAAKKGEIYGEVFKLKMQGKQIQEIADQFNLNYDKVHNILKVIRYFLRTKGFEKNLKIVSNMK